MTLSLRKFALALLGGACFVIAASGAASAGAPNGYFDHGYRYFGPGPVLPPPAYVEVVPVYPAPVYQAPVYPPAYAAPDYELAAPAYYEDGYGDGYGYDEPGFEYVAPDGAIPVGAE